MASEVENLIAFLKDRKLCFFHFTDTRNLPSVKERGLLSLDELKRRKLDFVPAGNDWSHEADAYRGVHRDVHLSFTANHPMEFIARKEKRIESTFILRIIPEVLATPGARISLGVANASGVEILEAEAAIAKLDLTALYPKQSWRDDETWARFKIARKCELLLPNCIAPDMIENL